MLNELKLLWQYRELLISMVQRDLKVRYKNSFLGFLWSLINPLMTVAVMSYIFKYNIGLGIQNLSAYILAAYLPYMFFSMSVLDATSSVMGNLGLVKKIYFPREILPLTSIISNFIHFMLAEVVFFFYLGMIYVLHPKDQPYQLTSVYLPILLVINFFLSAGLGMMLSALNTFYEDVKYVIGFVMQMLLFLSPIMWMVEKVKFGAPKHYFVENLINPIGILCNAYRKILLAPQYMDVEVSGHTVHHLTAGIEWGWIAYAGFMSLVVFFAGYAVFNKYKWKFVERP